MAADWDKACRRVDCTQADCSACFFYRAGGEDLKRFAVEYVKTHPSVKPEENKNDMPEIKPGDVIIFECYPGNSKPIKMLAAGGAAYGISAGDCG